MIETYSSNGWTSLPKMAKDGCYKEDITLQCSQEYRYEPPTL